MDKIKVVHIHGGRRVCGVATHILTLAEHFRGDRVEFHLALITDGRVREEACSRGIEPFLLGKRFPGDPGAVLRLRRYLSRHNVDLIHTHTINGNLYGRLAASLPPRIPVVTTVHTFIEETLGDVVRNPFKKRMVIWQNALTNRLATALIVPTLKLKNRLMEERVPGEKIHLVPNGIDVDNFDSALQRDRVTRKDLGVPENAFCAGTVARLVPVKNLPALIGAAAEMIEKRRNLYVLIVGDGPERGNLESLVREMGVEDKILFTGWRTDVAGLLKVMDAYVLPSFQEVFPYSVLEAMLAAKPVIAFDTGSLSEIIDRNTTGLLAGKGNNHELKAALEALYNDRERARTMGESGRNRVLAEFTARIMARNMEEFYSSILHA